MRKYILKFWATNSTAVNLNVNKMFIEKKFYIWTSNAEVVKTIRISLNWLEVWNWWNNVTTFAKHLLYHLVRKGGKRRKTSSKQVSKLSNEPAECIVKVFISFSHRAAATQLWAFNFSKLFLLTVPSGENLNEVSWSKVIAAPNSFYTLANKRNPIRRVFSLIVNDVKFHPIARSFASVDHVSHFEFMQPQSSCDKLWIILNANRLSGAFSQSLFGLFG